MVKKICGRNGGRLRSSDGSRRRDVEEELPVQSRNQSHSESRAGGRFGCVEREDSLLKRKKQVLFVGRLAKEKQVPELVEIWSLVEKDHPQWELTIVGDGAERPLVEERIRKHDLQRVRLIGKTPDVFLHYRSSLILVLSSAYEGLSLVLIEGLFFGLPEVSFDCPCGPDEIIEDGKNGFIIKDFDKTLFAQKLAELMENEGMREEFSRRSKELSRKYLPENILPQWEALFEELSSFTPTKGI